MANILQTKFWNTFWNGIFQILNKIFAVKNVILVSICSSKGLVPSRRQAIILTTAGQNVRHHVASLGHKEVITVDSLI